MRRFQILKIILGFAACFVVSSTASAQFADSPCDPDYYESLEARAWLEAQREITQNQNLIFKPDSVLEYTCFDKQLYELAEHATQMFSETDRWGDDVLGSSSEQDEHMDNALKNLVGQGIENYLQANFDHSFLGERSSESYTPDPEARGGTYTCDIMQKVWMEAKCMDFIDNASNDGFFTFEDYSSGEDKRFLPSSCGAALAQWRTDIDTSTGDDTPWDEDDVVTYLDRIFPTESECGSGAGTRIRTGMIVKTTDPSTPQYNEHACVVPGCYWNYRSSQCVRN